MVLVIKYNTDVDIFNKILKLSLISGNFLASEWVECHNSIPALSELCSANKDWGLLQQ